MLQIDLFGKILGRSIVAINVCEPTDMGGIVVALSGNLMMEINFRRGGNERETEIDMIECQKRRFIPALVRDNIDIGGVGALMYSNLLAVYICVSSSVVATL